MFPKPKTKPALWLSMKPNQPNAKAARWREYSKLKAKFLSDNPRCAIYPHLKATTVHHSKGRLNCKAGDLLLDTRWWVPASLEGHQRVEAHKEVYRACMWKNPQTGRFVPIVCAPGEFNVWRG